MFWVYCGKLYGNVIHAAYSSLCPSEMQSLLRALILSHVGPRYLPKDISDELSDVTVEVQW